MQKFKRRIILAVSLVAISTIPAVPACDMPQDQGEGGLCIPEGRGCTPRSDDYNYNLCCKQLSCKKVRADYVCARG